MERIQLWVVNENEDDLGRIDEDLEGQNDQCFVQLEERCAGWMKEVADPNHGMLVFGMKNMPKRSIDAQAAVESAGPERIDLTFLDASDILQMDEAPQMTYYVLKRVDYEYMRSCTAGTEQKGNDAPMDTDSISTLCLRIGMPPQLQGFRYVHDAIRVVLEAPDTINSITKRLYPQVAEMNETSASKVERSIRHIISVVWSRGRMDEINRIFGFTVCTKENKPTNGEFVALMAKCCGNG